MKHFPLSAKAMMDTAPLSIALNVSSVAGAGETFFKTCNSKHSPQAMKAKNKYKKINWRIRITAQRKVVLYAKRLKPDVTRVNEAMNIFCSMENLTPNKKLSHFLIDLYLDNHPSLIGVKLPKRRLKQKDNLTFYETKEWLELRKYIVKKYGVRCMKCGATDCEVHVDHIKPRSIFPELELCEDNLQVLCKACNMEKSNKDYTDYRTAFDRFMVVSLE